MPPSANIKRLSPSPGSVSLESVIYNSSVNQFERLLELGEGGRPAQVNFSVGKVDMTQVIDNMEEVPLVTEGEESTLYHDVHC